MAATNFARKILPLIPLIVFLLKLSIENRHHKKYELLFLEPRSVYLAAREINFKKSLAAKSSSRPILAWYKHGSVCILLPQRKDLTISMDIHKNPGPSIPLKQNNTFRSHQYNMANSLKPASPILQFDSHCVPYSYANRSQRLVYERSKLFSIRCYNHWTSTKILNNLKEYSLLKYRGKRAGRANRNRNNNNILISTLIRTRVQPQRNVSYLARHYRPRTLINVPICKPGPLLKTSKPIDFCLLNARSVNNKALIIKDYVVERRIGILALTETWLTSTSESIAIIEELCPNGYAFNHVPRNTGNSKAVKKGGGVGLLYKKCFKMKKQSTMHFKSFEFMEVVLQASSYNVCIIVVYRPPSTSNGQSVGLFFTEFSTLLEQLVTCPGYLLITGDFNLHVEIKSDKQASKFMDLLHYFNLVQHISVPTHNSNHTLDLVITRKEELIVDSFSVRDPVISDHFAVHYNLLFDVPCSIKKEVTYRKLRNINIDLFCQDLKKSTLFTSTVSNLSEVTDQYNDVLSNLVDAHAPLRKRVITLRPSSPWYTDEITAQKVIRRKLERRWRHSLLTVDRQLYANQCRKVNELVFTSKMNYYSTLIEDSQSDPKSFFRIVNKLLHRNPVSHLPSCDSSADLADKFSCFFMDKITVIRQNLRLRHTPSEVLVQHGDSGKCQSEFNNFTPITEEIISRLITKISSKSCMLDPIPACLLKNCLGILFPIITIIVNISLDTAVMPDSMKKAILYPLLKKTGLDYELFASFRPVSNLKFISKTIEKVVASQLQTHLVENNLNELYQSAYKPFHSTETALVRVQNDVLRAIDDRCDVILLLLDLSAAFDTVDHSILLSRLSTRFGIGGKALDWFKSYLSNRTQSVCIDGVCSIDRNVECGVPQGSVLGPILYLLYTSPLGDIMRRHNMSYHMYADDTQLYISVKSSANEDMVNAKCILESCVRDIELWMVNNNLKLNSEKTELLLLSSKFTPQPSLDSLTIGIDVICPSESARNIGVIFDSTVSMHDHVKAICKSSFYHLRSISKIRRYLSINAAEILVHAFITTKLDHCNSLLYGLPNYLIKKLQSVQNAAARLITYTRKYEHITPILIQLHWLPVDHRIQFKILLLAYKALNGLAPSYLRDIITIYKPNRLLRSSSSVRLVVPRYNLKTYGFRAFSVAAPMMWNRLPEDIRDSPSLVIFKSRLKTYFFKQAFE